MKTTILPLAVWALFAGALSVNTADAAPKHQQDPRKEQAWGQPARGPQVQTGHRPHAPKHQAPTPKHSPKVQPKHQSPAPKYQPQQKKQVTPQKHQHKSPQKAQHPKPGNGQKHMQQPSAHKHGSGQKHTQKQSANKHEHGKKHMQKPSANKPKPSPAPTPIKPKPGKNPQKPTTTGNDLGAGIQGWGTNSGDGNTGSAQKPSVNKPKHTPKVLPDDPLWQQPNKPKPGKDPQKSTATGNDFGTSTNQGNYNHHPDGLHPKTNTDTSVNTNLSELINNGT